MIESVTYNAVVVKTTVSKVEDSTVIVGKISEDEEPITLRAKKGYSFWKLELEPVDDKPQDSKACKNIVLNVKVAGKICTYKIPAESQVLGLPRY